MPKKYKTALVTGGAGFIGSHIVDALVRRRIKTYVVDDLSTGSVKNINPNAHFTKLSIVSPQFTTFIKRVKPDVIFHTAAQVDVRSSVSNPLNDANTNIIGTIMLVQAAIEVGAKKIIYSCSGGAIYPEDGRPPYSENVAPKPFSPYGISKHTGEMYLNYTFQIHGIPYVSLRYANVYGPRLKTSGEASVVGTFTEQMLAGKSVTIRGNGRQTRDFVYIEDVVRANMNAMNRAVVGEFNIGTGKQTDVNTLFKMLAKITGYKMNARKSQALAGEVFNSALSYRKARKFMGWEPKTKLNEGLEKTVKWYLKN